MYNKNYYYRRIHSFFPSSYLLTKLFAICTLIPSHLLHSFLPLPYYVDGTNRSGGLKNKEAKKSREEIYIQKAQAYSLQGRGLKKKKPRKERQQGDRQGLVLAEISGKVLAKKTGFGVCIGFERVRDRKTKDYVDMQLKKCSCKLCFI